MIVVEIVYVTDENGLIIGTQLPFSRILVFHPPEIPAPWQLARWSEQRERGLL